MTITRRFLTRAPDDDYQQYEELSSAGGIIGTMRYFLLINKGGGMRTDLDVFRSITKVFLDSDKPMIQIQDLTDAGVDISNGVGLFHYMLMIEQGFISDYQLVKDKPQRLGYFFSQTSIEKYDGAIVRLTAEGLEFAESLEIPSVFEKLKSFSDAPLSVIKDVGMDLAKGYLMQKLGIKVD